MKRLYLWLLIFFVMALFGEMMFWAGAASLPEVGPTIRKSLYREAPLVTLYMVGGETLGQVAPVPVDTGRTWASYAFEPGRQRMVEDPNVAAALIFDNTWNGTHRMAKAGVWGTVVLGVIALIAWLRRPRQVRLMGSRR
jgi:hypothetical protein